MVALWGFATAPHLQEEVRLDAMAERKSAAERSKPAASFKGHKQNEAQRAAAKENLAKGQAAKREQAAKAAEEGRDSAQVRWAKLLDGTITVQDLDDEEIARMRVRGKDGTFGGRRRPVPSHLAMAMKNEAINRAQEQFKLFAPKAVKRLLEIAEDPETKPGDAIRALGIALNRGLGKTPEVVRLEGVGAFQNMLQDAESVLLDRELADLAGEGGTEDA